jgi:hypothetical protein
MVAAAAVWLELALLCCGGLALFLRWGYSTAEAGTFAIVSVVMTLSLMLQVVLATGMPAWLPAGELLLVSAAAALAYRRRALLAGCWRAFRRSVPGGSAAGRVFGVCLAYLGLQCFLVPLPVNHWPELTPLLWHTGPGASQGLDPAAGGLCLPPLNIWVLSYLFVRFPTDVGLAGLGAMGYLAIVSGTYALARRHAWPPTAFTVALVVAGLPRLVLQAATPGMEILPAAVALFCLLCLYRLIEQPGLRDLLLLGAGLLFTAGSGRLNPGLSAILAVMAAVLLLRRHSAVFWWGLIRRSWPIALAALPAALVFSQVWRLGNRPVSNGSWLPAPSCAGLVFNDAGPLAAVDNALRYLLASIHLPQAVDRLSRWMSGFSPIRMMEEVQRIAGGVLGSAPAGPCPFSVVWLPDEVLSWFGPLAPMLVLPAVGYAAWRGTRRLRVIAVALIGYVYLAALVAAWSPDNAGLFAAWIACAGFLAAFLLPPWRISARGLRVLRLAALLLACHALAFNISKPLFGTRFLDAETTPLPSTCAAGPLFLPDRVEGSIWLESRWGADRWVRARRLFGDRRVDICRTLLPPGARVGVLAETAGFGYPFLAVRPDVTFLRLSPATIGSREGHQGFQLDYLLFVDRPPLPAPLGVGYQTVWESDPATARRPGALVRVNRSTPSP